MTIDEFEMLAQETQKRFLEAYKAQVQAMTVAVASVFNADAYDNHIAEIDKLLSSNDTPHDKSKIEHSMRELNKLSKFLTKGR